MGNLKKENRGKMKRRWFIFLVVAALSTACSNDIDIFADYKQMPIVYGLLDARADTNYVKITRAFYAPDDTYLAAANPDSSNYPGRLDVRLVEYRNGDSVREIVLDTITIHNKQEGLFYAPSQKLYYTAEPLNHNGSGAQYHYRLKAVLPDRVLTTETDMVGNSGFGVQSLGVNFSKEYFGTNRPFLFRPAANASIYQVTMAFTFKEQRTPDGDTIPRTFSWDIGTYTDEYLSKHMDGDCYVFTYRPENFYAKLKEFVGDDSLTQGVSRFISDYPVEVDITAGGEKLMQYIYHNDATYGFSSGDPEFSLIDGGYGVFSSRMTAVGNIRLAGETVPELVAMPRWGFVFIGGREE